MQPSPILDTKLRSFEPIPYDRLTLVGKELGDYNSKEYVYRGQLAVYRLRVGESFTDDGKVFYIYQDSKLFVNLYPSTAKRVFVGKDKGGNIASSDSGGSMCRCSRGGMTSDC